jgi:heptosyltransferase-3
MNIEPQQVKKLLVIKPRAVGDVLLSTVVIRNLRAALPHAEIHYLTEPPSAPVVANNPAVNAVVVFDPHSMSGLELIRRVRKGRYDLVFDLFGNPRTALVTRLSGARHRVGYRFRGRSYAYTVLVEPRGDRVHNTQFNLDALEAVGIPIIDRTVEFPVPAEDQDSMDRYLESAVPPGVLLVAVNTGGGWYTKRWPLERFARLADAIADRFGAAILLPWGPGQREEVETVRNAMHHAPLVPPPTTLPQLGALLKRCSLLVSNDSGPMHIGAAVGARVVGIYGPTNPILQGPLGSGHVVIRNERLGCLGCNLTSCPIGLPCMLELGIEEVMDGVERAMARTHGDEKAREP